MSSDDCAICYDEWSSGYRCPDCDTCICGECTDNYFVTCSEGPTQPVCTNPQCGHEIFYSETDKNNRSAYLKCMGRFLLASKNELLQEKLSIDAMVRKMRMDKIVFLDKAMPAAVALTAKLCMSNKLRTIDKKNRERIEAEEKKKTKACMRVSCRGRLDPDWTCSLCETSFCKECEKKKNVSHECKKEDIESVQEMKNGKRCPECGVAIFKYIGCQMMTCPVCKTNFHYETGERTQYGNRHNAAVKLESGGLYKVFRSELEKLGLRAAVEEIETSDITPHNPEQLTNALVRLADDPNSLTTLANVVKIYERLSKAERRFRIHQKALVEIEELIGSGTLSKEKLDVIKARIQ